MRLADLQPGQRGIVVGVDGGRADCRPALLRRLQDVGFVQGEEVRMITHAPWSADPVLVQIGGARFALRRDEAEQVILREGSAS